MKFEVEITVAGTVEANNASEAVTKLAVLISQGLGHESDRPYGAAMTDTKAHPVGAHSTRVEGDALEFARGYATALEEYGIQPDLRRTS